MQEAAIANGELRCLNNLHAELIHTLVNGYNGSDAGEKLLRQYVPVFQRNRRHQLHHQLPFSMFCYRLAYIASWRSTV